jgi:hypothetical protein
MPWVTNASRGYGELVDPPRCTYYYEQLCHLSSCPSFAFQLGKQTMGMQVQSMYPHVLIEAYGSVASNLPMHDSDVDLCIVFEDVEVSLKPASTPVHA